MDNIKAYWDKAHTENITSKLSGNGKETIHLLGVEDEFMNAVHILNIGVGTGAFEDHIRETGRIVDSMDISELALEKVINIARYRYMNPDAIPTSEYDLVTECQVALHLTDAEMDRHINSAIRGLNMSGIYAFNAPSFIEYTEETMRYRQIEEPTVEQMFCGYFLCRPISWYCKSIRKNGGQVVKIELCDNNTQRNVSTYVYHAQKRK